MTQRVDHLGSLAWMGTSEGKLETVEYSKSVRSSGLKVMEGGVEGRG